MGDRPEYAASLLRLATAMTGPAARPFYASGTQAIGVFDADILEERVMRLTMDLPKVSRTQRIAMAAGDHMRAAGWRGDGGGAVV